MAAWLDSIGHCILIANSTKTQEVFWTLVDVFRVISLIC